LDGKREYIHVLNPPTTATLNLPVPADGKKFTAAKLLTNGHPVRLVQDATGIHLTLQAGDTWSKVDTTIELTEV
jgi:hypothetical protein